MRIKLTSEVGNIHIYCLSAVVENNTLVLKGVTESINADLDAEGFDFNVGKDGEILVPLTAGYRLSFQPPREYAMTVLSDLATGEPFCFLDALRYAYKDGRRKVYNYLGAGYYSLPDGLFEGKEKLNTVVVPFTAEPKKVEIAEVPHLMDVIRGNYPGFRYNAEKQCVECLCGHPAPFLRTGYICGTITAYPCKYVKVKKAI